MRELAAGLVPEMFAGSYPYHFNGVFRARPAIVFVPKKDDLLKAMSSSWWDLKITDEEHDLVIESTFFDQIEDSPYYKIRLKENPGSVYDFFAIYRWGGDELVQALLVNNEYLSMSVDGSNNLVELLSSDWRLDRPLDAHELSLLMFVTSEYLYQPDTVRRSGGDTKEPFTADELLDIFLTDRAALAVGYQRYLDKRIYSDFSWFHRAVDEVLSAFRYITNKKNPLALLMELERLEWFDHKAGNVNYKMVADMAHQAVVR